jgi:hypothetical protein
MFNTIVEAGAVGAGTASCYGSGSEQMIRLLSAKMPHPPPPPHQSVGLHLNPSSRISFAEPHHFYAAPALGENFDADPASAAQALLLPYCIARQNFYNELKFIHAHVETILFI